MSQESMSIGGLAALTGVSPRTVRYYEQLGILPEPPRSSGGTRRYPPEYRFYIEGAMALKSLGFSLDEIRLLGRLALGGDLTDAERQRAIAALRAKDQNLQGKIEVLGRLRSILRSSRPTDPKRGLHSVLASPEPFIVEGERDNV